MTDRIENPGGALRERIARMMIGFQPSCVLGAAAELDLWSAIGARPVSAADLSTQLLCDERALRVLLDALVALGFLRKNDDLYTADEAILECLGDGEASMLPMVRHWLATLRGWSQLAWTARSGMPAPRVSGILGPLGEREAFIQGMHSLASITAGPLVENLELPPFRHVLDVGGATGSYTIAFLRKYPDVQATLFDLPDAVHAARERLGAAGLADRAHLVSGDFYRDELPSGADLAWVSAIIHQNNRRQNRDLFEKVFRALAPGGLIAIRDVVMRPDRTSPPLGALFAINMLVNTEGGGTFTFEEISEDLESAGFYEAELVVPAEDMNSVVTARKR